MDARGLISFLLLIHAIRRVIETQLAQMHDLQERESNTDVQSMISYLLLSIEQTPN